MACTVASIYGMNIDNKEIYTAYELDPLSYCVSCALATAALIPMCLIQDMQKFKYLGWIVLTVDICILLTCIVLIFTPKDGIIDFNEFPRADFLTDIAFLYLGQFCCLFETQIYFLQIMQFTNEKRRNQEGKPFIGRMNFLLVAYILLFSALCSVAYVSGSVSDKRLNPITFIENVLMNTTVGRIFYFQNVLVVFLSFPFKFFIAKEFLFILFDELKYRSLSTKIDKLKTYTSTRGVYTDQMIK
jgi:hypothetical protein